MKDDTVSRQKAIDAIKMWGLIDGLSEWQAIEILADEEKVPSAQQWIPCSERMPYAEYGESDTVLTTCGYRDVEDTSVRWIRILYFNGSNWCYPTGETYEQKVLAWMPRPEPWEEKEND